MASAGSRKRSMILGKYEVVSHIATGGMGAIYQAVDQLTGQEVALKVLPTDLAARPEILERFRREAEHGIRLRHENIVALFEFAEAQGTYFLVMEFVDGIDLFHLVQKNGPLDAETTRQILVQMAKALEHAHQQGIVHRDIKPSNIMITRPQGRLLAKLADLGLAREIRVEECRLTRAGTTVGTVDYLAPEQARDSGSADIRSDIYSLGCTAFHMLTGQPPFPLGSMTEKVLKHIETEPPDLRSCNPLVPDDLAAICRRMLAKKPGQRYQTPTQLLDDLTGKTSPELETPPRTSVMPASEKDREPKPTEAEPAASAKSRSHYFPEDKTTANLEHSREAVEKSRTASQLFTRGEYDKALQHFLACCQLDPANLQYRQMLRECQKRQIQAAGGPGWLGKVVSLYPKLWLKTAKRLHRPQRVLYHGEKVLARNPTDVGAQLDMAEAASSCGLFNLTLWILERAREVAVKPAPVYRALALFFEQQGDFQQAMGFWEQVDKAKPGHGEARHHLQDLAARDTIARGRYRDPTESRSTRTTKS